ncbi:MAG: hypothetical protein ACFCUJ_10710 [Thiotrichales bacterium]
MTNETDDIGARLELAQALARFKLQVRRKLNQSIDLESMRSDLHYARQRLAEIEAMADDEELLVAVILLRERLFPDLRAEATSKPETPATTEKYKYGPRS